MTHLHESGNSANALTIASPCQTKTRCLFETVRQFVNGVHESEEHGLLQSLLNTVIQIKNKWAYTVSQKKLKTKTIIQMGNAS